MAKNKSEHRIEYDIRDFFVEKLSFENNTLYFGSNARLEEVTTLLNLNTKNIAKKLELDQSNPNPMLSDDQIAEIATENNYEFEKVDDISEANVVEKIITILNNKQWPQELANITERPPIVTIMGHVDHGKTTLLDTIRDSSLVNSEIGGITQTIGAYQVSVKDKKITFIDTPGHEAFTEMRANGSLVTDIAIIIVAADDSIMNQTKESIDHAKAAGVPIIVAVNKMDAPGADIEKVKQDLTNYNVIPEEWGGDVPFVEISALKKEGIDKLLDTILMQSELLELTSAVNIMPAGTVIETNMDPKKGTLVSVILKQGTLKPRDTIIIDDFVARVKGIIGENGKPLDEALPGDPVVLYGIGQSPMVGTNFVAITDKKLEKIATTIHESKLAKSRITKKTSPLDLFNTITSNKKELPIILRADAIGVLKAIAAKIETLSTEDVDVKVIRQDVGDVTNTDISLASASNASIYLFNTSTPSQLDPIVKDKKIRIFKFGVIYKLFEDIEDKISGMTEDKFEFEKTGQSEVLQLFKFSKVGTIVGSAQREGKTSRKAFIKVFRGKEMIWEGHIKTLRIEKDQVSEVRAGQEFGLTADGFNAFEVGDIVESYIEVKVNG